MKRWKEFVAVGSDAKTMLFLHQIQQPILRVPRLSRSCGMLWTFPQEGRTVEKRRHGTRGGGGEGGGEQGGGDHASVSTEVEVMVLLADKCKVIVHEQV